MVSSPQKELHLLLVEDDEDCAFLMRRMLCPPGGSDIELDVADTLATALERIQSSPYDVILLDLSLPDARGLDGLRQIRGISEVPIVVVTGLADETMAFDAVRAGAQDYLVKGDVDLADVQRAVRYAMERHRLQSELVEVQAREQQLRMEKLESLGMLAGGIAHDFNNLLMGIMGNIALARQAMDEEIPELLAEAEKSSSRAASLIGQLLTFAKGGDPIKTVGSVGGLLEDSVSFALRGSNVKADVTVAEGLADVEMDPSQVEQVFQNIVINADQAMPQGGHIFVSAENVVLDSAPDVDVPPGTYVRITFRDAEHGIPKQHLSRIFDPYFSTKRDGSGLGLATAISIARKHGGDLTVDSVDGEGTVFCLYLPALAPSSRSEEDEPDQEELVPVSGRRILVMDDEEHIRELTRRYLERLGFDVCVASDGNAAIAVYEGARAQGDPFCAVVTDLTVPGGMGGVELMAELKEKDPDIKAIVSSGYSDDPAMSRYREYGFSGVLPKPYRMQQLGKALAALLSSD